MHEIDALPESLRSLVKWSVALLGQVIEKELGRERYHRIERLRREMASLRGASAAKTHATLSETFRSLQRLTPDERLEIARAYTLMLELMNTCENAYRSFRLSHREHPVRRGPRPDLIIYVLTAHPTEARSPRNIAVFHQIQRLLIEALERGEKGREDQLIHLLEIAWRAPIVRERSPRVKDEAEHVYTTLLRDDVLRSLLEVSSETVPVYFRTWVGGDKDGHPGVDARATLESLALSRAHLLRFFHARLGEIRETLRLFPSRGLQKSLAGVERSARMLAGGVRSGDAARVRHLRARLQGFAREYASRVGGIHPALATLRQLLHVFPALVVPLELRESSDVLEQGAPQLAGMLRAVAQVSRGGDPRWYARGLIVSMTESIEHLRLAAGQLQKAFGELAIPVIPLFEQKRALDDSAAIVREMTRDREISRAIREKWGRSIEVMVGYSDSSKEAGVLPSRLEIAAALPRLEQVCARAGLTPIFFHGSGGSVDRGGGTVQDQTAWWPRSALRRYKVTVQGEMVERSLATPEIARGQIERISESIGASLARPASAPRDTALARFAERVSAEYRDAIHAPEFLTMVEKATPYPFLSLLKIGSRPVKRTQQLTVAGLRAIPWVLCWTQTRVLFPTWWGIGTAWKRSTASEKRALKRAFAREPVFASYVRALGFTVAKVELPIWRIYLEQSGMPPAAARSFCSRFEDELSATREFLRAITGKSDPLWFRPWLGTSIRLRSPMIHPLNLLQIIAEERREVSLLRHTVTGISSGMLTTG